MTAVLITAEQTKYRVPGGIATYINGLRQGLSQLESAEITATFYDPKLPVALVSRMWDRGWAGVGRDHDVVQVTRFRTPPIKSPQSSMMVHDLLWREFPEAFTPRGRDWHEKMFGRALRSVNRFIVPSAVVRDQLVTAGVKPDEITVIAEGADHLPPADVESAEKLLAEHGCTGDVLLSVGTVEPRKNLAGVIEAFQMAKKSLSRPTKLAIVGPQGWGEETAPTKDVELLGRVSPPVLAGLYQNAKAFIYAPLGEGFGLPPLEAMWQQVPVLSSPVPSVAGYGGIVDPNSSDEMAKAIVELLVDDERQQGRIAEGKKFVQDCSWANTARKHVEVWKAMK